MVGPEEGMIELPHSVTPAAVEEIFRRARQYQEQSQAHIANQGFRAAKARDPKMMLCMEKCAEVIGKQAEDQLGRTRRDASTPFGWRVEPTEAQMFKEAYRCADHGEATMVYGWLYGAVATFCGVAFH
jgi:hypothetical protein